MTASSVGRYQTADATISAYNATAVTKSDATVLPVTRGLYIGVTGDVAVRMWGGGSVTFKNAVQGTILPLQVDQVLSTGTTATNILALY
jgi:hypothetical protein